MAFPTRSQLFSKLSIEQQILLAVCSMAGNDWQGEANVLLEKSFSWDQLVLLGDRHRMLPLLYKSLKQDFEHIAIPLILKEKYLVQTQQTLKLAAETVRISNLLTNEGVQNIILKGPFLGQQLYGDLALRPSRDIDILVSASNMDAFDYFFNREGYRLINGDFELSPKQKAYYFRHKNQVAYRHGETGIMVELHWRLFSQNSLFPISTEQVFSESEELIVAGRSISVLSKEHNFEFLCLHGAIHQWFRLRWLRDIAQLAESRGFSVETAMRNASGNGNERSVAQAIVLSNIFFGSKALTCKVNDKNVITWLVDQAITAAIRNESYTSSRKMIRLRIPFYKMKLKRGFRHKVESWKILNPNFSDWRRVSLPDSLFSLYFILRPFLWFYEVYIARSNRKKK